MPPPVADVQTQPVDAGEGDRDAAVVTETEHDAGEHDAGEPAPAPPSEDEKLAAMARAGKRGCAGPSHRIDGTGTVINCYPYRCRGGACLTRCKNDDDCTPSAKPGQPLSLGWPLLCGGHVRPAAGKTAECLPLPPEQVLGHRHP